MDTFKYIRAMFKNKVIIITGSTQGIGFKTAEMLLKRGARLVINSRSSEKVTNALNYLEKFNPNVIGLAGDVSKYEFCVALKEFALKNFGRIDILINNAGVASSGLLKESAPNALEKVVNINLLGSIYPTLACVNNICKHRGSILFISSVAGIIGLPNYSQYSATKRAVISLAESLKSELIDYGVFVGINYPGFTENEDHKTIINSEGVEVLLSKRPGINALTREQTAKKIIEQLQKKKFRMYPTISAKIIQIMYNLSPSLTLNIVIYFRKKIISMQ
tara:strand:- start:1973 stop:2803 length:831 start_codon:yes stop_codon:yes gene_type:complete